MNIRERFEEKEFQELSPLRLPQQKFQRTGPAGTGV